MSEDSFAGQELSRRKFLKMGAASLGALGFFSIIGCARARREPAREANPPVQAVEKGLIRPVRSPWFSELANSRVRCELCPRRCVLAAGERAPCRVRENRNGVGYTLAHSNPALVQKDPIERKPYFHVLPGSSALSIATAGCNLACLFCGVWEMALVNPEEVHAFDMSPARVVEQAKVAEVRSISYAFGEPVVFYEYMEEVAVLAREAGLLNVMHTAGYIQDKPLRQLVGKLDAVNVDLKGFDTEFYRKFVGGELAPVLASLKIMREAGVHIEITNLVIPTLNDDTASLARMCAWIVNELGDDVPVHFARFYPLFRLSALPRTPVSTLERARDTALAAGIKFAYIANVPGHAGENTFCPSCKKPVIQRVGFVVSAMDLVNGACKYCGAAIPGRWA